MSEISHLSWHKCYKQGWGKEIVPEAYGHPAKAARGLARRIYAHAIERGYLRPGDTCLDPFAGIGGFALDALANGLNWFGVELEQNFVDMGAGCDCTGISKDDWVACFGRWKRFAHRDGRHWCPRCLAEAEGVIDKRKVPKLTQAQAKRRARMRELMARTGRKIDFSLYDPFPFPESRERQTPNAARLFGAEQLVASYERSSGKIPHTRPHRYTGNLDLFAKHAKDGATAVLVQGDSRRLVEVLEGARAEGMIASPPYSKSHIGAEDNPYTDVPGGRLGNAKTGHLVGNDNYGTDPAQLGNMPTGEPPSAIVSSPPFGQAQSGSGIVITGTPKTGELSKTGGYRADMAGTDPLNLGNLPIGEPPSAVISSPPLGKAQAGGTSFWEGLEEKHSRTFSDRTREGSQGYREDQLGDSEGQLGTMPTGEPPQAVIASPPHGHDTEPHGDLRPDDGRAMRRTAERSYGKSDGQLAAMREGDVDAVIASPPWTSTSACEDPNYRTDRQTPGGPLYNDYGNSDGQLAALPEGEPAAGIVSSPPWESVEVCQDKTFQLSDGRKAPPQGQPGYGHAEGQLGQETGDTFWSAARAILLQCHEILAPGGVAIWVLKAFVRNKAIVDFPGQWEALCNSCGLETVEVIHAHLVEDRGEQFALNGDLVKRKVRRFSFFRRLHTKKYPHLAINWEIVLITRKGVA